MLRSLQDGVPELHVSVGADGVIKEENTNCWNEVGCVTCGVGNRKFTYGRIT